MSREIYHVYSNGNNHIVTITLIIITTFNMNNTIIITITLTLITITIYNVFSAVTMFTARFRNLVLKMSRLYNFNNVTETYMYYQPSHIMQYVRVHVLYVTFLKNVTFKQLH